MIWLFIICIASVLLDTPILEFEMEKFAQLFQNYLAYVFCLVLIMLFIIFNMFLGNSHFHHRTIFLILARSVIQPVNWHF